jgi:hypothetical protein
MNSTPRPVSNTRVSIFAALSLLAGLLVAYGFANLNVGYPSLNHLFVGIALLSCCGFTGLSLYTNYPRVPLTYWGSGFALLLSILPVYVALKSGDFVCHISTAKFVILSLAFAGACLVLLGFGHSLETRPSVTKPELPDGVSNGGWSADEIKHLCLVLMLLIALVVLWQKFLVECWS